MLAKTRQNSPKIFECKLCDYTCRKQSDLNKHNLTRKHENRTTLNNLEQENRQNSSLHVCKGCKKEYKARNSLWYHQKTCDLVSSIEEFEDDTPSENMIVVHEPSTDQVSVLTSLVMEIVKSNLELQKQSVEAQKQSVEAQKQSTEAQKQSTEAQKQMLELCKHIQPSSTNTNSHNNSHNTTNFNMQVFLNEECKDAINLSDFVNSFEVQIEDLESVGTLGYTTGMSNMIIKQLKTLDVYKRPIHCSDAKREIFYVKENNVWERETPENSTVKKAIQGVTRKNMGKLNDWKDMYPECMDSESVYNDIYINLMQEVCGGRGDTTTNNNKIFKNIMKEVLIKK